MATKTIKNNEKALLDRMSNNIDSLIENDRLILSQFEKLHDEVESLRDDVQEIKEGATRSAMQLLSVDFVEHDLKTIKRLVQEEPEKRRTLESRIRQVLPTLPK